MMVMSIMAMGMKCVGVMVVSMRGKYIYAQSSCMVTLGVALAQSTCVEPAHLQNLSFCWLCFTDQIAKKTLGYLALPRLAECCSLQHQKIHLISFGIKRFIRIGMMTFLLGIKKYIYRQIG